MRICAFLCYKMFYDVSNCHLLRMDISKHNKNKVLRPAARKEVATLSTWLLVFCIWIYSVPKVSFFFFYILSKKHLYSSQ